MVTQISNDLSPQNVNITIKTSINSKEIGKTIINDPNLNKILAPVQPIMQKTVNPIIDNFSDAINKKSSRCCHYW